MKIMAKSVMIPCLMVFSFLLSGCREGDQQEIEITPVVTKELGPQIETTLIVTEEFKSEGEEFRYCTLMDCSSGVLIAFEGNVPSNYMLDLEFNKDGEAYNISEMCEGDIWPSRNSSCREYFLLETPEMMTIIVQWNDQTLERVVQPEYKEFRPNGANCEPVCQVSSVAFLFPSP